MKIKAIIYVNAMLLVLFMATSCHHKPKVLRTDTETSGEAIMAADECFQPIVKEELDVFMALNEEATVTPIYTSEKEIFDLLFSDSVRLILAARDLTENEKARIKEMKLIPRSQVIAHDAIALIINKANTDSVINFATIKKIMTGEITKWDEIEGHQCAGLGEIKIVFDNPNSSTLRYINEKIVKGATISNNVRALNNNLEVLQYVADTPDAMGVIGINWISNPYDSTKLTFAPTIRVMAVGTTETIDIDSAYQPVPYYLYSGDYPLLRDIYMIWTDLRGTLPTGVVKYFFSESGRKIILNAGLVPDNRPSRYINVIDDFN